jgi:hypothetical protein
MEVRARLAGPGVALGLIATMLAAAPAFAQGRHPYQLLSRNSAGAIPNAPAFDPAISQDGRIDRYAAYSSFATDIVAGSGPHDNIFLVKRRRPWGRNGTPWRRGATVLISRGLGGAPANGDSVDPSFSGDDHHGARCLAFVSDASNLVRGDRNGHADVFVKRLPSGALHRIATPGPAQAVSVDGACHTLAFSADGVVYTHRALGGGRSHRVSSGRGAVNVDISVNGHFVVYDRNGYIYRDRHLITAGQDPSADGFGRYVAFWLNNGIYRANQTGAPHVQRVRQTGGGRASGASPSMTTGGSFIFYADGPFVRLNTYGTTMGECRGGLTVKQVQGSPHGNYDVFSCAGGAAYLDYIGGK